MRTYVVDGCSFKVSSHAAADGDQKYVAHSKNQIH